MPAVKKKRFVSLFFTQKKLQIVLLDNNKEVVEKFASIDLPVGLISNYKVVDKKKLAQFIIQSWQKLGIKEKNIGIVIPEFSTFIKSFTLPNLSVDELDEAIRWQAADVLPSSGEDLVLDWKIIEEKENEYNVLAVAVPRNVLSGYVDAAGLAGLYPQMVETPSISLTRISDSKESGKLVVYLTSNETLLVVARGDKIFGSSITSRTEEGIVNTAQGIVQHYSDIKIERIVVGGIGLTQELFTNLEQRFGTKPIWMQAKVVGLKADQIQELLVPLSLQYKDPKEPRDEYSINLLPPYWVKSYATKRLKRQVSSLALNTTLVLSTILILAFGFYLHLNGRLNRLTQETQATSGVGTVDVLSQVQEVNDTSEMVVKVGSKVFQPQVVMNTITKLRPAGISIDYYDINFETAEINIRGKANSRLILIDFKKKLEESEEFSDVDLPLSSLEKENNIDFDISFIYIPVKEEEKSKAIPLKIPIN